jgi:hypothetical protein
MWHHFIGRPFGCKDLFNKGCWWCSCYNHLPPHWSLVCYRNVELLRNYKPTRVLAAYRYNLHSCVTWRDFWKARILSDQIPVGWSEHPSARVRRIDPTRHESWDRFNESVSAVIYGNNFYRVKNNYIKIFYKFYFHWKCKLF